MSWYFDGVFKGLMDDVAPVTAEEKNLYKDIDFDVEDYRNDLGHSKLVHDKDKVGTVQVVATVLNSILETVNKAMVDSPSRRTSL